MNTSQTVFLVILLVTNVNSSPVSSVEVNVTDEDTALLNKKQNNLNKLREKAILTKTYFEPKMETDIIRLEAQVDQLRSHIWRRAFDDAVEKSGGNLSVGIDEAKELLLDELNNSDEFALLERRTMYEEVNRLTRLQWARRVLNSTQTQKLSKKPKPARVEALDRAVNSKESNSSSLKKGTS